MPGFDSRYWSDRTTRRRKYPVLKGTHTSDAVVIGGGLTGCVAAYVLANAGQKVILVESDRLAEGGTAGSLGLIAPQPDAAFKTVEDEAGRRVARRAWTETRRAGLDFAAAIRRLGIKCDLAPTPFAINARTSDAAAALTKERKARVDAGLDAPALSAAAARSALATDSDGAIRLKDAFTFDPVRAALGFAAAAEGRGARLFERSAVVRTRFTRKHATVHVGAAAITTRVVVVATAAPGRLFGSLRRHVRERDGFAVVTETMPAAVRRAAGWPGAVVAEPDYAWWRRPMPDGRLLFAGAAAPPVSERALDKTLRQRTAQLMYELSVRHPDISGLPAKWGWRVPVVSTADGLPWIGPHRNFPFHFFALAFGWDGAAYAWWAARAALRFAEGSSDTSDDTFGFSRRL